MNIISLFSGCGGLDLGFEKAGFNVIWANEFDPTIHDTYRHNHPHTELNTSDIRELSSNGIPDCDGIIGGPPCQSWSLGGKCLGIEDERGKLVFDYIRIVTEKKPKFFIMENVPGMVTPRHFEQFNKFLGLFRNAGYKVKYELVNAADFRIPQERLRVIIIGIRNDIHTEFFFPIPLGEKPVTLFQAIGDIKEAPIPYDNEEVDPRRSIIPNHDYYTGPFDRKYMARNRVRRWDELSFTIQAQAKNEPLHPQAPKMVFVSPDERKFVMGKESLYRRLSVRECARIQSFPDNFTFLYNTVQDGYKMVGNAVPPRLAYYLAISIKMCLSSCKQSDHYQEYALVGYVKSDKDFETIRRVKYYYIRGGCRPGAMQFGQISKPLKWLVLHRESKKELYELEPVKAKPCSNTFLKGLGFTPRGQDYWLFKIKCKEDRIYIQSKIIDQIKEYRAAPQIVRVNV